MTKIKTITAAEETRLRECLALDPSSPSGLKWKASPRKKTRVGDPAGSLGTQTSGSQHWRVVVGGKGYGVQNVIWMFLHGQWPADFHPLKVEHINGDGSDNTHSNLRLATKGQQARARKVYGRSSYKYVGWHKTSQKWTAQWCLPVTKKKVYAGFFTDELTAHRAALASRLERYDLLTGEWL